MDWVVGGLIELKEESSHSFFAYPIISVTLPHLLYHYELEYPALINPASTGMPVENFSVSCLMNSSGVRYPSELCGLSLL
jgi:hypothetical protein